ncbi:hypothetical protein [Aquimarina algicola]|uniref:T9SS type A sorting domain-containing protein n=1 Tax=Aquimarina algicola TaxID=2589995 RepID=A0A504J328_9FLAO|nr:hypothetical protein [Aquimarina algicola]TPN82408.1 hypothetical protein FHK87_23595 [Aquimarina algicola]
MKRVINLGLFLFALLLSANVKASSLLSVKVENASTINVSLSNISKGQKLYLKDYSGTILFNVTLDAMPSYKKYFNLNTVDKGIYFVETETEFDVKITPVLKNSKGIALIENSTVTIFKPKVVVEDQIARVMLTRVEKSPLRISIYDDKGFILFTEKIEEGNTIFERNYNFESTPSGKYTIYFALKDRVFAKEIDI